MPLILIYMGYQKKDDNTLPCRRTHVKSIPQQLFLLQNPASPDSRTLLKTTRIIPGRTTRIQSKGHTVQGSPFKTNSTGRHLQTHPAAGRW